MDSRFEKLASILVNYSCRLKKGEKVQIDINGADENMAVALVKEVYKAGGLPFVRMNNAKVTRAVLNGMTKELAETMARYDCMSMSEMQAYIAVRGGNNAFETSDVDKEKIQLHSTLYGHPVHHELRIKKHQMVRVALAHRRHGTACKNGYRGV